MVIPTENQKGKRIFSVYITTPDHDLRVSARALINSLLAGEEFKYVHNIKDCDLVIADNVNNGIDDLKKTGKTVAVFMLIVRSSQPDLPANFVAVRALTAIDNLTEAINRAAGREIIPISIPAPS